MTVKKTFLLNPAQERNLLKWSRSEVLSQAFPISIMLNMPCTVDSAKAALRSLIQMHEALCSRIVREADGSFVQQVVCEEEAFASVRYDVIDVTTSPSALYDSRLESVDPEEEALRCTLFIDDFSVIGVKLSVSHMFTDGIGASILKRHFMNLLRNEEPACKPLGQAGEYSRGVLKDTISENTKYWMHLLSDIPPACTYSGAEREEHENVCMADTTLTREQLFAIAKTSRQLRITEYAMWVTAASALVQSFTGQCDQVFRSTYANRFSAKDASVVAQLAQAVFVPISGSSLDAFSARARHVLRLTLSTYMRGIYDANGLMDWLMSECKLKGSGFQPAFEVNYLPALPEVISPSTASAVRSGTTAMRSSEEVARFDPAMAKADLAIQVLAYGHHASGPAVRLWARKPVYSQRSATDLLQDLLVVMRSMCEAPEQRIDQLSVVPFASVSSLLHGHHSKVAIDSEATMCLLLQIPGVVACDLDMEDGVLTARLEMKKDLADRSTVDDIRAKLRGRQPWYSGSIVPDRFLLLGPANSDEGSSL